MIDYGSSHWGLGVLIGLPVWLISIAAFVFAGFWLRKREWDSYDRDLQKWLPRISWIIAGILVVIMAGGYLPYQAKYHKWQNISGTVSSTNSRFLVKSGATDQKFVVTFQGSNQQFGCNDTRCATIEPGDHLQILCMKVWQIQGSDGYDCNFVDYKKKEN